MEIREEVLLSLVLQSTNNNALVRQCAQRKEYGVDATILYSYLIDVESSLKCFSSDISAESSQVKSEIEVLYCQVDPERILVESSDNDSGGLGATAGS